MICGSGTCRKSKLLPSLARPGALADYIVFFFDLHAESDFSNWESGHQGFHIVLHENVLGLVDIAVYLGKSTFTQKLPSLAQSFHLHVTAPAFTGYLMRLP